MFGTHRCKYDMPRLIHLLLLAAALVASQPGLAGVGELNNIRQFASTAFAVAPADIVLPVGLELPISLDITVPVDAEVPVVLQVPVNIPLSQTELHEPFVGLQEVVAPYQGLLGDLPDAWLETPFCQGWLGKACIVIFNLPQP